MDLEGARVLVTGASSGIGAAVAVAFARAGSTVGICARRADRLAAVLDRCRETAPASRLWAVDVADLDALPGFAACADDELGGVDVLVNNAGIPMRRRMQELTLTDLETVMRVNFYAPVVLTSALLPRMLERGRGRIVNVSSMGTRTLALGVGAYAASKAALELYTEGLYADLLGTGVTAQLFVPGSTNTEFSMPRDGDRAPAYADPNAMEPEPVADALIALVRGHDFEGHASDALARLAQAKRSDPNRFLEKATTRVLGTEIRP